MEQLLSTISEVQATNNKITEILMLKMIPLEALIWVAVQLFHRSVTNLNSNSIINKTLNNNSNTIFLICSETPK